MKYEWGQLSVMFGQLGLAARQLSGCDAVAIGDEVHAIVAAVEESAGHPNEIVSLTPSEPV